MLWSKAVAEAHTRDVSDPVLPRRRKVPRRYEIETGEVSHPENITDVYSLKLLISPSMVYKIDLISLAIKYTVD